MNILTFCLSTLLVFGTANAYFISENLKSFDIQQKIKETSINNNTVVEKEPPYTHLLYFLQYVILGPPKNASQPDIFDLIQEAPDEIDLLTMIIFASQAFNEFWVDNEYDEDTFEGYTLLLHENKLDFE